MLEAVDGEVPDTSAGDHSTKYKDGGKVECSATGVLHVELASGFQTVITVTESRLNEILPYRISKVLQHQDNIPDASVKIYF